VIAKYYSLRQLGVDTAKLRITYVKAVRLNEAHMVLTYFPTPDAVPLVLDNLINIIAPASKRPDLVPVYSFNAEGMWLERLKGQGILMGNPNKLDLWTDLRVRMQAQGMDLLQCVTKPITRTDNKEAVPCPCDSNSRFSPAFWFFFC